MRECALKVSIPLEGEIPLGGYSLILNRLQSWTNF